jgi:hypothetical protein
LSLPDRSFAVKNRLEILVSGFLACQGEAGCPARKVQTPVWDSLSSFSGAFFRDGFGKLLQKVFSGMNHLTDTHAYIW